MSEGKKDVWERLQKHKTKLFFFFEIVIIAAVLTQYAFSIYSNFSEEIVNTLQEVTVQGVNSLQTTIKGQLNSMESISKIISSTIPKESINADNIVDKLEPIVKDSRCKRMGFIDTKGNAYTTDGKTVDLSERDFFKASMGGMSVVSNVLDDKITDGKIHVYSVPLYVGGQIKGAIFATFDTAVTQSTIEQKSFNGEGYSYIIDNDGTTVVSSSNPTSFDNMENIFTSISDADSNNIPIVRNLANALSKGESGYTVFKNGGKKYLYYMPIGINDWYLVTVVPQSVLHNKFDYVMFWTYLLCGGIIVGSAIYLIHTKKTEEKNRQILENIVFVDDVTQGISFNKFKKDAETILNENIKNKFAVVDMDIKHFRYINDVFGINEGNKLICYIFDIVNKQMKQNELVSHISADHFIVLLSMNNTNELEKRVRAMCAEIKKNTLDYDIHYKFNIAMGIYFIEDNSMDIESLIEKAKSATKSIKDKHNCDYCIFDTELQNKILIEKQIEDSMADALENEEFVVYYQPKFSVEDKKLVGAEALVRWNNPKKGIVSPGVFIPIFEGNGFIMELDTYVFEKVCKDIREWLDKGIDVVPVSVNLSQVQFSNINFVGDYLRIMKKYKITSEYVQLELTESCLFENVESMLKVIDILHQNGVKILIDDFGKGYSSLNMLKNIPIDILKLDKTFIDDIGTIRSERIIENVISLAQSLDMKVVAEGVEAEMQYNFLYDMGCDEIQGYYFSKPVVKEKYVEFLEA